MDLDEKLVGVSIRMTSATKADLIRRGTTGGNPAYEYGALQRGFGNVLHSLETMRLDCHRQMAMLAGIEKKLTLKERITGKVDMPLRHLRLPPSYLAYKMNDGMRDPGRDIPMPSK